MIRTIALLCALVLAAPAAAQDEAQAAAPKLTLEQETTVRCGTAFAIVAVYQEREADWAMEYPLIDDRGREFFVRSNARLMDELQLGRPDVEALYMVEAVRLRGDIEAVQQMMPACLALFDASGL